MNGKWHRAAWIVLALALNVGPLVLEVRRGAPESPPHFVIPPATSAADATPFFHEEFIDPNFSQPSVHVASLCELADGGLGASWYGGTREGASDVAVFFSRRNSGPSGAWTQPVPLINRKNAQQETWRFVRKVGNPLLFSDPDGTMGLLYVSIAVGGWSGSSLNVKLSHDGGSTWTASRRLGLSPFFNMSELVKSAVTPMSDGSWAVPIYHEAFAKYPEVLWLRADKDAVTATKTRIFSAGTAFQPTLVASSEKEGFVLCRTASSVREAFESHTMDAGRTWSAPKPTGLPNPDSGVAAIRLQNGRILVAFNDSRSNRSTLRLAVSENGAPPYQRVFTVAEEREAEFSYPFLLATRDGLIHLAYTWKRTGIKHVAFNMAWLEARTKEAAK